jgi:hypothetical protein
MAKEAGTKALLDAKVSYKEIQQVIVGYVYGMGSLCIFVPMIPCGQVTPPAASALRTHWA